LIHIYPSQSASQIFLNCTKNTELTARPFAPTFTLALNKKLKLGQDGNRPGKQPGSRHNLNQQSTIHHGN
jgi:hypothetical protein